MKINSFDDKTQRWANSGDILLHNLLDNRGLSGIIKAAMVGAQYVDQQTLLL